MAELNNGELLLINNAYRKIVNDDPKQLTVIEIGDTKQPSQFYPQLKFSKWGSSPDNNEVNFSVRLKTNIVQTPVEKDGVITTENVKFYDLPDGKQEFDITLKEKPLTNVIEFTIQTKGLVFLYQPKTLKQPEIDNNCTRPDDVKGSYAIYHENPPLNIEGGTVYGTGKAFHIYRPKIIDSIGTEVWGKLNVDSANGLLTVTIPQTFLDNAVYPIRHAAGLTIGHTGAGASFLSPGADRIYAGYVSSVTTGKITKLTASVQSTAALNYKGIILVDADPDATIVSNGVTPVKADSNNGNEHWETIPYTTFPALDSANGYHLGLITDVIYKFFYDATAGYYVTWDATNSYTTPEDMVPYEFSATHRMSIYATYEDTYAVTFSVSGANGTIAATVDATPITSGDAVVAGKDVIFTGTPSGGYQVADWLLDDASTATSNKTYTVSSIAAITDVKVQFEIIPPTPSTQIGFKKMSCFRWFAKKLMRTITIPFSDISPLSGFSATPTNVTTVALAWTNPTNASFSNAVVFSSASDLSGRTYSYCLANATQVYSGASESCNNTSVDTKAKIFYAGFARFSSGGSFFSSGVTVSTEITIFIGDYFVDTWNNAITDANTEIVALGGGTVIFPAGNYLITPVVNWATNVKYKGVGTARLYSEEAAVYNYLTYANTKTGITFENLTFDQRTDAALLPTTDPYKACMGLYFSNCDNIDVHDCTFYAYGILAVYADAWNAATEITQSVKFKNNYVYWQRKVDTWYDASIIHFHTKTLECSGNYIESMVTGFSTHVVRSGIEAHFPNGYISNNTFTGCQVGILYNPWPSTWNNYDAAYVGAARIDHNSLVNCGAIGLELWLGFLYADRNMKNLTIEDNTIGLYLKNNAYSKPGEGIVFYRGGAYACEAYDVIIRRNDIALTYDAGYCANLVEVRGVYSSLQYGENTGAFNLNVANNMHDVEIYSNTVAQFPYSLLNLYRRSGAGVNVHVDVNFHNNGSTDSHYAAPYYVAGENVTKSDHCFTVGECTSCEIDGNTIVNTNIALIGEKEELANVTNLTYTGNTFT